MLGNTVVFAGDQIDSERLTLLANKAGLIVETDITPKTDFLVVSGAAGSAMKRANDLSVRIVSENWFLYAITPYLCL